MDLEENVVLNIQFQVAGMILLTVIIIMYTRQRALNLLSEKYFMRVFFSVYFCVLTDIISVVAIGFSDVIPDMLCKFACKLYLVAVVNVAVSILVYTMCGMVNKKSLLIRLCYNVPFALFVVAVCFLPLNYYLGEDVVYTYGKSVEITYVVAVLYIIAVACLIVKYRKALPSYKRSSITFLIIVWFATALIQFFNQELLLVSYSISVSVAYMYMKLENPENNIDRDTGAFNRNALYTYITTKQERDDKGLSLLVISINDFKFITETFGYKNANSLLKAIVNFLNRNEKCEVFKRSESAFTIIYDDMEELKDDLERIKSRFEMPWKVDDITLNVYFKACYIFVKDKEKPDGITETINYFLLKCKNDSNSIIEIDEPKLKEKNEISRAEHAVKRAIETNSIDVYYQPIYSTEKGKYISAEALVRIKDEDGNFISPELFIPISEQNGKILEIGKMVFEKVCRMIKETNPQKYGIEYIEVNLSVVQCMQDNLAETLIDIMKKYDVPPSYINLEITETAAVKSEKIFEKNMEKLINAGATFSIDDYGSGYSNMNYVIGLPISIVKIDKDFVWSYFKNEKARIAFEFAISMLHNMELKIVAEGIEEKNQADKMHELGVDDIQGYYYSKPVNSDEFIDVIKTQYDD